MRPIVVECDGCGTRVECHDYGIPEGWVKVKAHQSKTELSEAEAEYCGRCGMDVDAIALAQTGRPWAGTAKAKRKSKPKVEVEVEMNVEGGDELAAGYVDPEADEILDGLDHGE